MMAAAPPRCTPAFKSLMNHGIIEAGLDPGNGNDGGGHVGAHMPRCEKAMASTASRISTAVNPVTTARVVPAARLSESGLMRKPKWQLINATVTPNNRPLSDSEKHV